MSALVGAALLGGLAAVAAVGVPPQQLIEQRLGVEREGGRSGAHEPSSRLAAARDGGGSPTVRAQQVFWAVGAAILLLLWMDLRLLVPSAFVAAAAVGALVVRSRIAARTQAVRRRARVLETCDQLAAELSSGQAPPRALRHAAMTWPDLAPVAAAAQLGGEVPAAWRTVAERPGADSLRSVAAAWQVAERSGAGLALVLDRISDALRGRRRGSP